MIKAFGLSVLLIIVFFLASITDIFVIFTYKATFYVALVLLVVVFITAFVVTKSYEDKRNENEEKDK